MQNEFEKITDEAALQNLLLDMDCLDELLPWTSKLNLFDILKISRTEIRHSNMLSWLFNANENHGFGDLFTRGIVKRLVENDSNSRYNAFDLLLMDFYSFIVYREWKNIDILLVSSDEKQLIAIENKVGSLEHSNQLNRYREILEKEYPDYSKIYVYLTPDGDEPSDAENWDVLTYSDIVDTLEILKKSASLQSDVNLIIQNYIDIIRRDIVEDSELVEICNKIYNKHKKALDLIFENRIDTRSQVGDAIRNTLCALTDENRIEYENHAGASNSYIAFHTSLMNDYLYPLKDNSSTFNSKNIYNYWINCNDNMLCGIFELGGLNVPEAEVPRLNAIIDILKPNDKNRENFRYKRVYRTKSYSIENLEDFDNDIDKTVRLIVKDLTKMETEVLNKLTKE